ncbi:MAG: phosphoribosylanthranilate isomerase [Candidatus Omnitrophica bacterium]|nr:phosphoribosylanthranilate isomerase [Candidatus Omnitrophota bacterium]
MTRIKICGITNKEDAFKAIKLGAHALGFIFHKKSPRFISPSRAKNIIAVLPPFVTLTGVFVNERGGAIRDIISFCGLNAIQLHGEENHHDCHRLKRYNTKIIKAFRVNDTFDFAQTEKYDVDAMLFDTYQESVQGGTGKVFNWELLKKAKVRGAVILSGGLNSKNVFNAIQDVRPYGVDVSSGVEASVGVKDHRLLEEFIRSAQSA